MNWNEKPLTGFSKQLFDCFKPADANEQLTEIESLGSNLPNDDQQKGGSHA